MEDKTLTIGMKRRKQDIRTENPSFMTVNTQLILIVETFADRPEYAGIVGGIWEAVDERR